MKPCELRVGQGTGSVTSERLACYSVKLQCSLPSMPHIQAASTACVIMLGHPFYVQHCLRAVSLCHHATPPLQLAKEPVLNARGLSGWFGPTRFSVIPKTAVGKLSVRFVPRQDPNHIIACLQKHIESEHARLGSANSVR
eukprot:1133494-Pelagomonas_calceolata.AAC.4